MALTRRQFLERSAELTAALAAAGACGPMMSRAGTGTLFRSSGEDFTLGTEVISATWSAGGGASGLRLRRVVAGTSALQSGADTFALSLNDGSVLASSGMRVVGTPSHEALAAKPGASRLAERIPGRQITVVLEDPARRVRATWRAIVREGGTYVRQEVVLEALQGPLPVREIALVDVRYPESAVSGLVKGSPIVAGQWFAGVEHPLSASNADRGWAGAVLPRELPLRPGAPLAVSSVIGITRPGQLRRDFLDT